MSASENTPPRSYDFEFPLPPDAPYETRKDFVKYQLENTLSKPWSAKCIQEIYAEMFQYFSRETFKSLPPSLKGELRNCLESQGINIRGGSSRRVTDELFLAMEYSHTWPDDDDEGSRVEVGKRNAAKPSPETPHPPPLKGPQGLPDSHVSPMPSPFREFRSPQEMTTEERTRWETLSRNITNLAKQYSDADRYSGASHENFDDVALIFSMRCRSSGILDVMDLPEAFHVMLKGMALAYFLRNFRGKGFSIETIYSMMRDRFHTHEHAMALERQWDFSTFQAFIDKNPEKPLQQALDEYVTSLYKLQAALPKRLQHDESLRNKLYNATLPVPACSSGRVMSRGTSQELISSLQASIAEWEYKRRASDLNTGNIHYTDRRYNGKGYNGSAKGYGGNAGRGPRVMPRSPRPNQYGAPPWKRSAQGSSRSAPPDAALKRCFVCRRLGCWSTNHPVEERRKCIEQHIVDAREEDDETRKEGWGNCPNVSHATGSMAAVYR